MTKQQLWIAVGKTLKPFATLAEAVKSFKSLADFITNDEKVVCLTYDASGSPEARGNPMWEIREVPLKEVVAAMKEAP